MLRLKRSIVRHLQRRMFYFRDLDWLKVGLYCDFLYQLYSSELDMALGSLLVVSSIS
jgi:hypothetical protein